MLLIHGTINDIRTRKWCKHTDATCFCLCLPVAHSLSWWVVVLLALQSTWCDEFAVVTAALAEQNSVESFTWAFVVSLSGKYSSMRNFQVHSSCGLNFCDLRSCGIEEFFSFKGSYGPTCVSMLFAARHSVTRILPREAPLAPLHWRHEPRHCSTCDAEPLEPLEVRQTATSRDIKPMRITWTDQLLNWGD